MTPLGQVVLRVLRIEVVAVGVVGDDVVAVFVVDEHHLPRPEVVARDVLHRFLARVPVWGLVVEGVVAVDVEVDGCASDGDGVAAATRLRRRRLAGNTGE